MHGVRCELLCLAFEHQAERVWMVIKNHDSASCFSICV